MSNLRIGDIVTWSPQSGGRVRTHTGVVAARVPSGKRPINYLARGTRTAQKLRGTYPDRVFRAAKEALALDPGDLTFKPLSDGAARPETSFLVVSYDGGVYWPKVSMLQKV